MRTGPASGDGTGCTPHRRGCRFRRAGSVQRRTGPRSARTGAACCGGRTPGSPGPVLLPGAVVRRAGQDLGRARLPGHATGCGARGGPARRTPAHAGGRTHPGQRRRQGPVQGPIRERSSRCSPRRARSPSVVRYPASSPRCATGSARPGTASPSRPQRRSRRSGPASSRAVTRRRRRGAPRCSHRWPASFRTSTGRGSPWPG